MNKTHGFFAVSFVALCVCATAFAAQNVPNIMSKYGEIQSVNKYSSNPFWTPNSPYNQRFPTPIYATGPDLNTGDCNRIVQNLVSTYCADRQNCSNLRIADVRPNVMVQLSQLPGHNFATSCGGYIDTIFENYKKTYGNSSAGIVNIVPTQTKTTAPSIQIENPFTTPTTEFDERAAELERLQRQTTATAAVTPAAFPKTIDDLSFTDRMANASAGYEPYKDLSAYKTPKFETENEYYERMKSVLTHNISYVGAGAKGCPQTYMTGRGATVSCTPTINHGTCSAWCTDAALTNCQTSYTISPNDRDDKIFYGKCTCNTGYEMDGYKCVKPGAPVDLVDPVIYGGCEGPNPEHRDPTTCECYQSDFMDPTSCSCKGMATFNTSSKKCECPTINKGTLTEIQWEIAKKICKCPLTTQTYNTTTHLCESDQKQSDGKTYAILQCRTKKAILNSDLSSVLATEDPAGSLGCSTYTHADINECFTPCQSKESYTTLPQLNRPTALITSKIKEKINRDFCAGNRYHNDGTGSNDIARAVLLFSQDDINLKYAEKNKYLTFTNLEIEQIKEIIEQNQNNDSCSTSNHWWWMIYVLEQTTPGKWIPIEALTLYHK